MAAVSRWSALATSIANPDDARFLSLAKTTGAWLTTGNLKHYPAKARGGVIVRTPVEYGATLDG